MKIKHHGGSCCGMLHIHGMGQSGPNGHADSLIIPLDSPSQDNLFRGNAPAETTGERLKRYLEYIKANLRTECIIEVTLTGNGYYYEQQGAWEPFLRDLGFERVSHCYNSGSTRRIVVYHLCWDNASSRKSFEKTLAALDREYAAKVAAEAIEAECKKVRATKAKAAKAKAKPAEPTMPPAL